MAGVLGGATGKAVRAFYKNSRRKTNGVMLPFPILPENAAAPLH
ncbi:hypothetical protein [Zavarzinella formosa]|nr:hypothetical protein [Zavarzinella formosa]